MNASSEIYTRSLVGRVRCVEEIDVFIMILLLATPVLVISMIVGLVISVFQAVTQIQESTLTFVPKIIAGLITLTVPMPWTLNVFVD